MTNILYIIILILFSVLSILILYFNIKKSDKYQLDDISELIRFIKNIIN